jgi:hypothetical protein
MAVFDDVEGAVEDEGSGSSVMAVFDVSGDVIREGTGKGVSFNPVVDSILLVVAI